MRISDWSSDVCSSDLFALAYDRRGNAEPASLLVHNYPDAWAKVYVGFDLGGADPVRRAGERSMTGFRWDELESYIPLTRSYRQMLHVGREYGLADGYTVPRLPRGDRTSVVMGKMLAIRCENG